MCERVAGGGSHVLRLFLFESMCTWNTNMKRCLQLLTVTLGLVAAYGSGWVRAGELPRGREVRSQADIAKHQKTFYTRISLEAYRQHHPEPTDVDKLGEAFLERWIDHVGVGYANIDNAPLVVLGEKAAKAGCVDPMFCRCYGRLMMHAGRWNIALKQFALADQGWPETEYAPFFHYYSVSDMVPVLYQLNRSEEATKLRPRLPELAVKAFVDHPYHADETWLNYSHASFVFDFFNAELLKQILDEVLSHDDIDPWMRHMMLGRLNIKMGWKQRGAGWASRVSEEGWQGFAEHLATAKEHLLAAWEMNPDLPYAPTSMISIAMAGHADGDTPREWFERAVAAQLDYIPAYEKLRYALLPRWGGSHEEVLDLGEECLETARYDTDIPFEYFNCVARIVSDIGQDYGYYERPDVYENMMLMCDEYIAEPKFAFKQDWYRSLKVGLAYRARQWEDGANYYRQIVGDVDLSALRRLDLVPNYTIGEILARSGDLGERHAQVDELLASGQDADAIQFLEEMVDFAADQPQAVDYLREKLLRTEFDIKYATGEWVDIMPNKHFDGWKINVGNWAVSSRGKVTGAAETAGLLLVSKHDLGTRFEIRGKTRFLRSPYSKFNIGIWFGQRTARMNDSFRYYEKENYAAIYGDGDTTPKDINVGRENAFILQRWDDTLTAYFNDELILSDVPIRNAADPEDQTIGIGGYYWYSGPVIRFDLLEVRRIDDVPLLDEEPSEDTELEPEEEIN